MTGPTVTVEGGGSAEPVGARPTPEPVGDGTAAYALSPIQSGMLFHALTSGMAGVDHEQVLVRFAERIDVPRLEEAWRRVVARHDILRTAFAWLDRSDPQQVVHTAVAVHVEVEEEDGAEGAEEAPNPGSSLSIPAWLEARLDEDRRNPFALDRAPLMRFVVRSRGPRESFLVWSFHHTLLDGRSFPIVLGEVLSLYDHPQAGSEALGPPPLPYRHYIDWLAAHDTEASSAAAEAWFKGELAGFREATPLPGGPPRRPHGAERSGDRLVRCVRELDPRATADCHRFAAEHGVSVNTLLQGAWALLLARASGERDVVFGATRACRRWDPAGGERRVGLFINTLPLRARPEPELPVGDYLRDLRARQLSLRPFEHTPLARVQKWSDIRRGQSLFESLVVYDTSDLDGRMRSAAGAAGDARAGERRFAYRGQTNYPLTLLGYDGARLRIELELDPRRIDPDQGDSILDAVVALLQGLCVDAGRPLREVPSAGPELLARLVAEGRPRADFPFRQSLHGRFAAQAAVRGEALALSCEGVRVSYRELDRCSNRLAHELRRLGVGRNVLVGLSAERSVELVIGIVGILKAGGAYLPLDPHYPRDRLAFMIEDSGVAVVVADGDLGDLLRVEGREGGAALRVDVRRFGPGTAGGEEGALPDETRADDLAYVIYTSGSTGRPKGAEITHGNVTRLFDATFAWFEYGPDDVWSMFHSCSFDFSVYELWGALLYGGHLVVVPWWVSRSPDAFHKLLVDEKVTVLCQTPSAFRQLTQVDAQLAAPGDALALRAVVFGGEALDMATLRPWVERHGAERPSLVNMYGITETTVHVTYRVIRGEDVSGGAGSVIGGPIPDLGLLLVDGDGQPCPSCLPGELWVSGAGLSRGYRGRPELTAERFVSRSFAGEPPSRYYRSGDLARRLPDGDLEYLGRIDLQVKIRGFRIELGEIESVLAEQEGVTAVVVDARPIAEDGRGDRRLVAYVASLTGDPAALVVALRERVRARLPDHMVPSAFVVLPALPLNQNGKIDRKALPAPEPLRATTRAYVPPHTELEVTLARVWSEVIGVATVGVADEFFELGGDSLLLVRVYARLRELLGRPDLSIVSLLQYPTIQSLARHLAGESDDRASATTRVIDRAQKQREAARAAQLRQRRPPRQ